MKKETYEKENIPFRIVRHKIYDRLLFFLENKRNRVVNPKQNFPFILHKRTKQSLGEKLGFSQDAIRQLENSILANQEKSLDVEIVRDVPVSIYRELEKSGETRLIFKNRIVALPNPILNACVCGALEREFSRAEILACNGFHLCEGYIRLDLDEIYIRSGFLMPNYYKGLITALRVFRNPDDEKPFILRTRQSFNQEIV